MRLPLTPGLRVAAKLSLRLTVLRRSKLDRSPSSTVMSPMTRMPSNKMVPTLATNLLRILKAAGLPQPILETPPPCSAASFAISAHTFLRPTAALRLSRPSLAAGATEEAKPTGSTTDAEKTKKLGTGYFSRRNQDRRESRDSRSPRRECKRGRRARASMCFRGEHGILRISEHFRK